MNNDQTSVDVVIPSYRPDENFSRLVKKLQEQKYPIGTIFVINTKAGRFPKEVEQMEKVKVSHIERREFDHGATRDMGMQMSKAEIVVFMTQDAVPADEYVIGNLVKVLEERRREFAFLGIYRFVDLKRLNKESRFQKTITHSADGQTWTLPPNDNRYIIPIPPVVKGFRPDLPDYER